MLEKLFQENSFQDDTDYYRAIRRLKEQPIDIPDGKEFTQDEVRQVIVGFKLKKAAGPVGITGGILQLVYKGTPKTMAAMYNEAVKIAWFSTNWKRARIIPITKPGRVGSRDSAKYRPNRLIKTVGRY